MDNTSPPLRPRYSGCHLVLVTSSVVCSSDWEVEPWYRVPLQTLQSWCFLWQQIGKHNWTGQKNLTLEQKDRLCWQKMDLMLSIFIYNRSHFYLLYHPSLSPSPPSAYFISFYMRRVSAVVPSVPLLPGNSDI